MEKERRRKSMDENYKKSYPILEERKLALMKLSDSIVQNVGNVVSTERIFF